MVRKHHNSPAFLLLIAARRRCCRLDSQRHFYDSQLSMVAAEHERCKRRLSAMEKKCAEQAASLAKAEADRSFMEEVNASMKANQSDWQSRVSGQIMDRHDGGRIEHSHSS